MAHRKLIKINNDKMTGWQKRRGNRNERKMRQNRLIYCKIATKQQNLFPNKCEARREVLTIPFTPLFLSGYQTYCTNRV